MTTPFQFDVSEPAPGPWRLPNDNERRTHVMFVHPFRDCRSVCEANPDLENYTDATMRLIALSPDMKQLLERMVSDWRIGQADVQKSVRDAQQLLDKIAGK